MRSADAGCWHRYDVRRIEDLANAVLGAQLNAVQMEKPPLRGSLAFAAGKGIIFSSGRIEGKITIDGPLSRDAVTLLMGLRFGPGSRYWLNPVRAGDVGVFLPGDEHDAFLTEGSLYLTATLSVERLEEEAEREDLLLGRKMTDRTGLHSRPIPPRVLRGLRRQMEHVHRYGHAVDGAGHEVGTAMVRAVMEHYARVPTNAGGRIHPVGRARVLHRAREYIRENLARPITLETLATAADTSQRTLSRSFVEVLQDTPGNHVRRLRLHRIRHDLVSGMDAAATISGVAARWGIHDPGRMSRWYRELFGESPSETLATHRQLRRLRSLVL